MKFPVSHQRMLAGDDWGQAYGSLLTWARDIEKMDIDSEEFRTLGDIWEESGSVPINILPAGKRTGVSDDPDRASYHDEAIWVTEKDPDVVAELPHAYQYHQPSADSTRKESWMQRTNFSDLGRYFLGPETVEETMKIQYDQSVDRGDPWSKKPGDPAWESRVKEYEDERRTFQHWKGSKARSVENEAHYKIEPWFKERLDEASKRDAEKRRILELLPEISGLPAHSEERRKRFTKTTPLETYND